MIRKWILKMKVAWLTLRAAYIFEHGDMEKYWRIRHKIKETKNIINNK